MVASSYPLIWAMKREERIVGLNPLGRISREIIGGLQQQGRGFGFVSEPLSSCHRTP